MTIHKRDFAVPPFEIIHARSKDEIQQCFNIVSSPHSHWNDSISLSLSRELMFFIMNNSFLWRQNLTSL